MTLEQHCRDFVEHFPARWAQLIEDFRADGPDAFGLFSHASYLFRTSGVRWGMDLSVVPHPRAELIADRAAQDLAPLAFTLITHFHSDHFNPRLCACLAGDETLWIVPDFAPESARAVIEAAHANVRYVTCGDVLSVAGYRILVLPGHHYDDGGTTGTASYTYAVETPGGKKLYFPGDTRDFRTYMTVDYPHADAMFAHVWLGRTLALAPLDETFLDAYCDYLARAQAKHVYLAHLYNFARETAEMWGEPHARAIAERLRALDPAVCTHIPRIGVLQTL